MKRRPLCKEPNSGGEADTPKSSKKIPTIHQFSELLPTLHSQHSSFS